MGHKEGLSLMEENYRISPFFLQFLIGYGSQRRAESNGVKLSYNTLLAPIFDRLWVTKKG